MSQTKSRETGASADQLISQIMTSSYESDKAQQQPESDKKKPWDSPVVAFTGVVLVVMATIFNVVRMTSVPDGFTPQEAATYVNIVAATTAIESYSDSTGRLPSSLSQLPIDQTGLSYTVTGTEYTLSTVMGDRSVTHNSGVPLFPLQEGFDALQMKGPR